MGVVEAKEEIRSRLNIEDVIGQYVQLKRAGRNFKGLSPFSQEKSASFMVSPDKHIWHDFSSGKGGDVFAFVMEMEGLDFKGAMELLARRAGVDLTQYHKGDSGISKKKDRLFAANEKAAYFFQKCLLQNMDALEYVRKKRQFSREMIGDFKIGYSPNNYDSLFDYLKKSGFSAAEVVDAGLASQRSSRPVPMFRGRMMIGLADPQGRIIGFTARILKDEPNAPKYINTPQTLLYDKSRHVFGLHLAKDAIRQSDFVVVVEGNADVIASHQVGVKNVVATAGTALTDFHLKSMSRFTQDIRLAFDADKAGVAATERAIAIASNLGISLSIITISDDAKDPDELIQKDVELWRTAINAPQDAVEWLLSIYAKQYDLTSAEGKRRITDRVLGIIKTIEDPVLLEHYLGVVSKRIATSIEALDKKLHQQPQSVKPSVATNARPAATSEPDVAQYQDHLLAMVIAQPKLGDSLLKLESSEFSGDLRQKIVAHLKGDVPLLQSDEISVKMSELELIAETKYASLSDELYHVAADIAKRIKKESKQKQLAVLSQQFVESNDSVVRKDLNKQIKQLVQEIEALRH